MKSVSDGEKFPAAKFNVEKKCGENSDEEILRGEIGCGENIMRQNLT